MVKNTPLSTGQGVRILESIPNVATMATAASIKLIVYICVKFDQLSPHQNTCTESKITLLCQSVCASLRNVLTYNYSSPLHQVHGLGVRSKGRYQVLCRRLKIKCALQGYSPDFNFSKHTQKSRIIDTARDLVSHKRVVVLRQAAVQLEMPRSVTRTQKYLATHGMPHAESNNSPDIM